MFKWCKTRIKFTQRAYNVFGFCGRLELCLVTLLYWHFCLFHEQYIVVRRYFSQWPFPKGDFPSDNFPNMQFPKLKLPKVILDLLRCRSCIGYQALWLEWAREPSAAAREVAAWEIAHLGRCHLGKYPWEVAAWEMAFGKVRYIVIRNP